MNSHKHLTDEALILHASAGLPDEFQREARAHLSSCEECRAEESETRYILTALRLASERGLLPSGKESARRFTSPQRSLSFPWIPVTAILSISALLIIALLTPTVVPGVSAAELMDRALVNEKQIGPPVAFDVSADGTRCGAGRTAVDYVLTLKSAACQTAVSSLAGTAWAGGSPLSASRFQSWRSSLTSRNESVTNLASAWVIQTSTPVGSIRRARLSLRKESYHPFQLQLLLSNQEEISFTEGSLPTVDDPDQEQAKMSPSHPDLARADGPADMLEVEAWQMLHDLNADTGWEAQVVRHGDAITVEAEVSDDARKQEFEAAFRPYPKITLRFHEYGDSGSNDFLPRRKLSEGGAPPLANDWLESRFQDSDARSHFVNSTINLSKILLGRAYMLEQLRNRRAAMAACACAKDLDAIIGDEQDRLEVAQAALRSSLEPLTGIVQPISPSAMTVADAQRLDTAVLRLLSSTSPNETLSLDAEKKIVEKSL